MTYEKLDDRVRKVMQLSNQEAQRLNHEYIAPEHILLGIVREGSGTAAYVLRVLGIDIKAVGAAVIKIVTPGPDLITMGKLPLTPRSQRVMEYAIEESNRLNHNFVGTEHLLIGLLREDAGIAAQALRECGVTLDAVLREVSAIFPNEKRKRGMTKQQIEDALRNVAIVERFLNPPKGKPRLAPPPDIVADLCSHIKALVAERESHGT